MEQSVRELRARDLRTRLSLVDRVRPGERESMLTKNDIEQVLGSKADEIDQIEEVHHKNGHLYLALVALTDMESQVLVTGSAARNGAEASTKLVKRVKPWSRVETVHIQKQSSHRSVASERDDREVGLQRAQV